MCGVDSTLGAHEIGSLCWSDPDFCCCFSHVERILNGANLSRASFSGSTIRKTDFTNAILTGAIFINTEPLTNAILTGATLPDGTIHDESKS